MNRRRRRGWGGAAVVLAAIIATCGGAFAGQIKIPLEIDYAALDAAIKQQLYTSEGGRADLWHGANDCEYAYVEEPHFGRGALGLMFDTDGELSIGVAVGGRCISPIGWSGVAEVETAAYISGVALKLRVTDVNLYGKDHRKSIVIGRGLDLIKGNLVPKLETFSYDLGPAIRQLGELAQLAATAGTSGRIRDAMSTLRLGPEVVVQEDGVRLTLELMTPEGAPTAAESASAPALKPEEVAAWRKTLADYDAFFEFAIKQIGMTVGDETTRGQLFDVLIDGRERLVKALGEPEAVSGPDPVRVLFLDEWNRLRGIIKTSARSGKLGSRALEFLSFISAGDALFALDQAAPALGMRVSADDLRRLARIMAPEIAGDPLEYSFDEDPELRKIFRMSGPLETPGALVAPDESEAPTTALPTPAPSGAPTTSEGATPQSTFNDGIGRALARALDRIGPGAAYGAETGPAAMLLELGRILRGVVVDERNADRYRNYLTRLLGLTAQRQMDDGELAPQYRKLYAVMVKTVAWQESCWRQFVVRRGRIWYLESKTGDIGLMQVNKYVWRGFYSLPRLRWDIVYNSGAGAEILTKMLSGASRRADRWTDSDSLARSAYAAYNGGPGAYNRWRMAAQKPDARAADEGFWLKFRAMSEGQSFDIVRCAKDWEHSHGQ